MRKRIIIFITILLMFMSGCVLEAENSTTSETDRIKQQGQTEEQIDHKEDSDENREKSIRIKGIPAKVVHVVDGDTIDVQMNDKKERIRMILVDTPETKHPRLGEQPFGKEASAFTEAELTGKEVILELGISERDQYGRLLAYIWVDERNFNQLLIEKGLARVAEFPPNTEYVDEFRAAEAIAQERELGIWSIENYIGEKGFQTDERKKHSVSKHGNDHQTNKGCHIKGNFSRSGEKIYHMPDGAFYDQTKPEEWFCTKEEAEAAGFRASKK